MEKMNIDAIRFLASIIDVASQIKEKLENDEGLVTNEHLKKIMYMDDNLDVIHFELFEEKG